MTTTRLEEAFFENWNRYYDPFTGRYLQPEPVLHHPWWPKEFAQAGHSLPTYAYALNNPVHFTDPDGQVVPLVIGGGILISEILIPAVIARLATAAIVETECEKDKFKKCNNVRSRHINKCKQWCRKQALTNWDNGERGTKPSPSPLPPPFGYGPFNHPDTLDCESNRSGGVTAIS